MVFKINIAHKGRTFKLETDNEAWIRMKIGDKIDVNGTTFEIVGQYEKMGDPSTDNGIFVTDNGYTDLFGTKDKYAAIIVQAQPGANVNTVAEDIKPAFTTGTTISSSDVNADLSDIASALTQSVSKDGQTAMTGTLNMGSNPITNTTTFTATGLITGSAITPSGSSVPVNGLYYPAANKLAWATNSTLAMSLDSTGNLVVVGNINGAVITGTSFSGSASGLTSIPAANLTGTIAAISGANVTNLNGSNVASGTVAAARIDANVYRGSLGSGVVTVQSGGSASGGSNGDIFLIY